jgi:hypothetical protein
MKKLIPLLGLAACVATPQPPIANPVPDGLDDTCHARAYTGLINQDATALEKVLLLGQVRVIRPGSVVTQDYRPERINFHVNTSNRIDQITCG